jgi:hypothetical protein
MFGLDGFISFVPNCEKQPFSLLDLSPGDAPTLIATIQLGGYPLAIEPDTIHGLVNFFHFLPRQLAQVLITVLNLLLVLREKLKAYFPNYLIQMM